MRLTLATGQLVHPSEPPATSAATAPVAEEKKVVETQGAPVRFVKNLHTREKLTFPNGNIFVFPGQVYVTSNPEEIAQIRAIAVKSHITES
jgi:hypothetical protein